MFLLSLLTPQQCFAQCSTITWLALSWIMTVYSSVLPWSLATESVSLTNIAVDLLWILSASAHCHNSASWLRHHVVLNEIIKLGLERHRLPFPVQTCGAGWRDGKKPAGMIIFLFCISWKIHAANHSSASTQCVRLQVQASLLVRPKRAMYQLLSNRFRVVLWQWRSSAFLATMTAEMAICKCKPHEWEWQFQFVSLAILQVNTFSILSARTMKRANKSFHYTLLVHTFFLIKLP